jgi:FkbM family methyltransferase
VGHGGRQKTSSYTIQGKTFDNLCDVHLTGGIIDICKMDIEGAEAEILRDSSSSIQALRRCRYFLIEMHPIEHYQEMRRVLEQHGFTLIDDEGKKQ